MKLKLLSTAMMLAALPTTGTFAAALDRSGQSISAFLQPNNYAEIGMSYLSPKVEGKDTSERDTGDMANSYNFFSGGVKIQASEKLSFGLLYDEPFGADATYKGNNSFTANQQGESVLPSSFASPENIQKIQKGLIDEVTPLVTASVIADEKIPNEMKAAAIQKGITDEVTAQMMQISGALQQLNTANLNAIPSTSTHVDVQTRNITAILGFEPMKGFKIYGGPVYQEVEGNVSLRGSVYSVYNGYDAHIDSTDGWGWLAGLAYEIPEIALKASITYRSEVDHDAQVAERLPVATAIQNNPLLSGVLSNLGINVGGINLNDDRTTKITTPQSVNLDLQSGIMANTVAFTNIRWVNWKDFAIQPTKFGNLSDVMGNVPGINRPNGFNLVDYSEDQWSINAGIGRKLTETIGGTISVGWDSGAGNPVTTLGPTKGFWNIGLGVRYAPTPKVELSAGAKYFWLGDADAVTGAHTAAGTFKDSTAWATGVKLGYRF